MLKEPINIISNSAKISKTGGPSKVFTNTVKGFDKIGQTYSINEPISNHKYNWIHDSVNGFIEVIVSKQPALLGPNLFVFPEDIPFFLPNYSQNIFLHPSSWCVNAWKQLDFNSCKLNFWPVGIDLEDFIPSNCRNENEVLLYFKKRKSIKMEEVIERLEKQDLKVNLISYGSYNEAEYKSALKKSSFGVWVGTTESQGIGLQEALATNLPLIVLENTNILDHETPEINDLPQYASNIKGTSIPYWDNNCGIAINHLSELDDAIYKMRKNIEEFTPRKFIENNLSLEKCAKELVGFFDKLDFKDFTLNKLSLHEFFTISAIKNIQFIRHNMNKLKRKLL